jgi:hypothetical protein
MISNGVLEVANDLPEFGYRTMTVQRGAQRTGERLFREATN